MLERIKETAMQEKLVTKNTFLETLTTHGLFLKKYKKKKLRKPENGLGIS